MKLCIALDMPTKDENLALVNEIKATFGSHEIWLKVGLRSFIRDGKAFLEQLKRIGFHVFLDLKIYDIPNTMLDSIKECQNIGIDMLTIHASCGSEAMRLISSHISTTQSNLKIIAVSALTSFDDDGFMQVYNTSLQSGVRNFANLVYRSGIHGLVCSSYEVEIVKHVSQTLLTIVPGIRPNKQIQDDQKRIADVSEAKKIGSDFIVVGRPIYCANDKLEVIQEILTNL